MQHVIPTKRVAAVTMLAMAIMPSLYVNAEPKSVIRLTEHEMPQVVPRQDKKTVNDAVKLYHELRTSFRISHITMASWLGIKRRTLYNWMNQSTQTSRYGSQVESRLFQLNKFKSVVETEHIKLVNKIAFSPIYGDPKFGDAIIKGANSEELLKWYDHLFSRFESYKSVQNKNNKLS